MTKLNKKRKEIQLKTIYKHPKLNKIKSIFNKMMTKVKALIASPSQATKVQKPKGE